MSNTKNLSVYLNDFFVGVLTQFPDGRTFLAFGERYLTNSNRPVLSLSYKNIVNDIQSNVQPPVVGLPAFFANLLPEGLLRTYLAKKAGVKETQEFRLLTALRDDLPGAVILQPDIPPIGRAQEPDMDPTWYNISSNQPLRFSLAGVQMKFSGDLRGDKVTIPAQGMGGHWIVKLPSAIYPNLVELEYAMLHLAQRIGISVPEFKLVSTAEIENLPRDVPEAITGDALVLRRFDRTMDGGRIHMEDFAQVFAVFDKYDRKFNYQSIANVLWQEIGLDATLEFVRRLVHMVMIGNADMHLKNWSLIYPDGVHPRLSPGYDFVSTIVYPSIEAALPQKLAGEKHFRMINLSTFKDFAKIAQLPERPVINCVLETVDAIKECWTVIKGDLPIPPSFTRLIEDHMRSVPLSQERATMMPISQSIPLNMTWPGSFINCQIDLDPKVSSGKIVYKNQAETTVELDAPRRMVQTLLQKQAHQLLMERRDFANQLVVGYVGQKLYDEWRRETFIRIEDRMVEGGLTEIQLQQPELAIRAGFFPIDWRNIELAFKNKEQRFSADFVLENGDVWTSQVTLTSLTKLQQGDDGRRIADLRFYMQNAHKLYTIPEEDRIRFGSSKFALSPAQYDKILKSLGEKEKENE